MELPNTRNILNGKMAQIFEAPSKNEAMTQVARFRSVKWWRLWGTIVCTRLYEERQIRYLTLWSLFNVKNTNKIYLNERQTCLS